MQFHILTFSSRKIRLRSPRIYTLNILSKNQHSILSRIKHWKVVDFRRFFPLPTEKHARNMLQRTEAEKKVNEEEKTTKTMDRSWKWNICSDIEESSTRKMLIENCRSGNNTGGRYSHITDGLILFLSYFGFCFGVFVVF